MSAVFIVRAQLVDPSVKEAFDKWYRDEHLAVCEFDDIARVRALFGSAALKALVAEFDRAWGEKVTRTREVVQVAQRIGRPGAGGMRRRGTSFRASSASAKPRAAASGTSSR